VWQALQRYWRRLWRRTRDLWERAKREHSTPWEVGWSVAIGVFCGCTPFIGFHMWMALGLATVFRLNRLWAFLGSRCSPNVVFAWIAFSEIEVAHRLRAGNWETLAPEDVLSHGRQLLGDWLLGSVLVGGAAAALLGLLAYRAACGWQRRHPAVKPPRPDAAPPPSSGSRPSAPPAPTP
jgi:uncharacterized protein